MQVAVSAGALVDELVGPDVTHLGGVFQIDGIAEDVRAESDVRVRADLELPVRAEQRAACLDPVCWV